MEKSERETLSPAQKLAQKYKISERTAEQILAAGLEDVLAYTAWDYSYEQTISAYTDFLTRQIDRLHKRVGFESLADERERTMFENLRSQVTRLDELLAKLPANQQLLEQARQEMIESDIQEALQLGKITPAEAQDRSPSNLSKLQSRIRGASKHFGSVGKVSREEEANIARATTTWAFDIISKALTDDENKPREFDYGEGARIRFEISDQFAEYRGMPAIKVTPHVAVPRQYALANQLDEEITLNPLYIQARQIGTAPNGETRHQLYINGIVATPAFSPEIGENETPLSAPVGYDIYNPSTRSFEFTRVGTANLRSPGNVDWNVAGLLNTLTSGGTFGRDNLSLMGKLSGDLDMDLSEETQEAFAQIRSDDAIPRRLIGEYQPPQTYSWYTHLTRSYGENLDESVDEIITPQQAKKSGQRIAPNPLVANIVPAPGESFTFRGALSVPSIGRFGLATRLTKMGILRLMPEEPRAGVTATQQSPDQILIRGVKSGKFLKTGQLGRRPKGVFIRRGKTGVEQLPIEKGRAFTIPASDTPEEGAILNVEHISSGSPIADGMGFIRHDLDVAAMRVLEYSGPAKDLPYLKTLVGKHVDELFRGTPARTSIAGSFPRGVITDVRQRSSDDKIEIEIRRYGAGYAVDSGGLKVYAARSKALPQNVDLQINKASDPAAFMSGVVNAFSAQDNQLFQLLIGAYLQEDSAKAAKQFRKFIETRQAQIAPPATEKINRNIQYRLINKLSKDEVEAYIIGKMEAFRSNLTDELRSALQTMQQGEAAHLNEANYALLQQLYQDISFASSFYREATQLVSPEFAGVLLDKSIGLKGFERARRKLEKKRQKQPEKFSEEEYQRQLQQIQKSQEIFEKSHDLAQRLIEAHGYPDRGSALPAFQLIPDYDFKTGQLVVKSVQTVSRVPLLTNPEPMTSTFSATMRGADLTFLFSRFHNDAITQRIARRQSLGRKKDVGFHLAYLYRNPDESNPPPNRFIRSSDIREHNLTLNPQGSDVPVEYRANMIKAIWSEFRQTPWNPYRLDMFYSRLMNIVPKDLHDKVIAVPIKAEENAGDLQAQPGVRSISLPPLSSMALTFREKPDSELRHTEKTLGDLLVDQYASIFLSGAGEPNTEVDLLTREAAQTVLGNIEAIHKAPVTKVEVTSFQGIGLSHGVLSTTSVPAGVHVYRDEEYFHYLKKNLEEIAGETFTSEQVQEFFEDRKAKLLAAYQERKLDALYEGIMPFSYAYRSPHITPSQASFVTPLPESLAHELGIATDVKLGYGQILISQLEAARNAGDFDKDRIIGTGLMLQYHQPPADADVPLSQQFTNIPDVAPSPILETVDLGTTASNPGAQVISALEAINLNTRRPEQADELQSLIDRRQKVLRDVPREYILNANASARKAAERVATSVNTYTVQTEPYSQNDLVAEMRNTLITKKEMGANYNMSLGLIAWMSRLSQVTGETPQIKDIQAALSNYRSFVYQYPLDAVQVGPGDHLLAYIYRMMFKHLDLTSSEQDASEAPKLSISSEVLQYLPYMLGAVMKGGKLTWRTSPEDIAAISTPIATRKKVVQDDKESFVLEPLSDEEIAAYRQQQAERIRSGRKIFEEFLKTSENPSPLPGENADAYSVRIATEFAAYMKDSISKGAISSDSPLPLVHRAPDNVLSENLSPIHAVYDFLNVRSFKEPFTGAHASFAGLISGTGGVMNWHTIGNEWLPTIYETIGRYTEGGLKRYADFIYHQTYQGDWSTSQTETYPTPSESVARVSLDKARIKYHKKTRKLQIQAPGAQLQPGMSAQLSPDTFFIVTGTPDAEGWQSVSASPDTLRIIRQQAAEADLPPGAYRQIADRSKLPQIAMRHAMSIDPRAPKGNNKQAITVPSSITPILRATIELDRYVSENFRSQYNARFKIEHRKDLGLRLVLGQQLAHMGLQRAQGVLASTAQKDTYRYGAVVVRAPFKRADAPVDEKEVFYVVGKRNFTPKDLQSNNRLRAQIALLEGWNVQESLRGMPIVGSYEKHQDQYELVFKRSIYNATENQDKPITQILLARPNEIEELNLMSYPEDERFDIMARYILGKYQKFLEVIGRDFPESQSTEHYKQIEQILQSYVSLGIQPIQVTPPETLEVEYDATQERPYKFITRPDIVSATPVEPASSPLPQQAQADIDAKERQVSEIKSAESSKTTDTDTGQPIKSKSQKATPAQAAIPEAAKPPASAPEPKPDNKQPQTSGGSKQSILDLILSGSIDPASLTPEVFEELSKYGSELPPDAVFVQDDVDLDKIFGHKIPLDNSGLNQQQASAPAEQREPSANQADSMPMTLEDLKAFAQTYGEVLTPEQEQELYKSLPIDDIPGPSVLPDDIDLTSQMDQEPDIPVGEAAGSDIDKFLRQLAQAASQAPDIAQLNTQAQAASSQATAATPPPAQPTEPPAKPKSAKSPGSSRPPVPPNLSKPTPPPTPDVPERFFKLSLSDVQDPRYMFLRMLGIDTFSEMGNELVGRMASFSGSLFGFTTVVKGDKNTKTALHYPALNWLSGTVFSGLASLITSRAIPPIHSDIKYHIKQRPVGRLAKPGDREENVNREYEARSVQFRNIFSHTQVDRGEFVNFTPQPREIQIGGTKRYGLRVGALDILGGYVQGLSYNPASRTAVAHQVKMVDVESVQSKEDMDRLISYIASWTRDDQRPIGRSAWLYAVGLATEAKTMLMTFIDPSHLYAHLTQQFTELGQRIYPDGEKAAQYRENLQKMLQQYIRSGDGMKFTRALYEHYDKLYKSATDTFTPEELSAMAPEFQRRYVKGEQTGGFLEIQKAIKYAISEAYKNAAQSTYTALQERFSQYYPDQNSFIEVFQKQTNLIYSDKALIGALRIPALTAQGEIDPESPMYEPIKRYTEQTGLIFAQLQEMLRSVTSAAGQPSRAEEYWTNLEAILKKDDTRNILTNLFDAADIQFDFDALQQAVANRSAAQVVQALGFHAMAGTEVNLEAFERPFGGGLPDGDIAQQYMQGGGRVGGPILPPNYPPNMGSGGFGGEIFHYHMANFPVQPLSEYNTIDWLIRLDRMVRSAEPLADVQEFFSRDQFNYNDKNLWQAFNRQIRERLIPLDGQQVPSRGPKTNQEFRALSAMYKTARDLSKRVFASTKYLSALFGERGQKTADLTVRSAEYEAQRYAQSHLRYLFSAFTGIPGSVISDAAASLETISEEERRQNQRTFFYQRVPSDNFLSKLIENTLNRGDSLLQPTDPIFKEVRKAIQENRYSDAYLALYQWYSARPAIKDDTGRDIPEATFEQLFFETALEDIPEEGIPWTLGDILKNKPGDPAYFSSLARLFDTPLENTDLGAIEKRFRRIAKSLSQLQVPIKGLEDFLQTIQESPIAVDIIARGQQDAKVRPLSARDYNSAQQYLGALSDSGKLTEQIRQYVQGDSATAQKIGPAVRAGLNALKQIGLLYRRATQTQSDIYSRALLEDLHSDPKKFTQVQQLYAEVFGMDFATGDVQRKASDTLAYQVERKRLFALGTPVSVERAYQLSQAVIDRYASYQQQQQKIFSGSAQYNLALQRIQSELTPESLQLFKEAGAAEIANAYSRIGKLDEQIANLLTRKTVTDTGEEVVEQVEFRELPPEKQRELLIALAERERYEKDIHRHERRVSAFERKLKPAPVDPNLTARAAKSVVIPTSPRWAQEPYALLGQLQDTAFLNKLGLQQAPQLRQIDANAYAEALTKYTTSKSRLAKDAPKSKGAIDEIAKTATESLTTIIEAHQGLIQNYQSVLTELKKVQQPSPFVTEMRQRLSETISDLQERAQAYRDELETIKGLQAKASQAAQTYNQRRRSVAARRRIDTLRKQAASESMPGALDELVSAPETLQTLQQSVAQVEQIVHQALSKGYLTDEERAQLDTSLSAIESVYQEAGQGLEAFKERLVKQYPDKLARNIVEKGIRGAQARLIQKPLEEIRRVARRAMSLSEQPRHRNVDVEDLLSEEQRTQYIELLKKHASLRGQLAALRGQTHLEQRAAILQTYKQVVGQLVNLERGILEPLQGRTDPEAESIQQNIQALWQERDLYYQRQAGINKAFYGNIQTQRIRALAHRIDIPRSVIGDSENNPIIALVLKRINQGRETPIDQAHIKATMAEMHRAYQNARKGDPGALEAYQEKLNEYLAYQGATRQVFLELVRKLNDPRQEIEGLDNLPYAPEGWNKPLDRNDRNVYQLRAFRSELARRFERAAENLGRSMGHMKQFSTEFIARHTLKSRLSGDQQIAQPVNAVGEQARRLIAPLLQSLPENVRNQEQFRELESAVQQLYEVGPTNAEYERVTNALSALSQSVQDEPSKRILSTIGERISKLHKSYGLIDYELRQEANDVVKRLYRGDAFDQPNTKISALRDVIGKAESQLRNKAPMSAEATQAHVDFVDALNEHLEQYIERYAEQYVSNLIGGSEIDEYIAQLMEAPLETLAQLNLLTPDEARRATTPTQIRQQRIRAIRTAQQNISAQLDALKKQIGEGADQVPQAAGRVIAEQVGALNVQFEAGANNLMAQQATEFIQNVSTAISQGQLPPFNKDFLKQLNQYQIGGVPVEELRKDNPYIEAAIAGWEHQHKLYQRGAVQYSLYTPELIRPIETFNWLRSTQAEIDYFDFIQRFGSQFDKEFQDTSGGRLRLNPEAMIKALHMRDSESYQKLEAGIQRFTTSELQVFARSFKNVIDLFNIAESAITEYNEALAEQIELNQQGKQVSEKAQQRLAKAQRMMATLIEQGVVEQVEDESAPGRVSYRLSKRLDPKIRDEAEAAFHVIASTLERRQFELEQEEIDPGMARYAPWYLSGPRRERALEEARRSGWYQEAPLYHELYGQLLGAWDRTLKGMYMYASISSVTNRPILEAHMQYMRADDLILRQLIQQGGDINALYQSDRLQRQASSSSIQYKIGRAFDEQFGTLKQVGSDITQALGAEGIAALGLQSVAIGASVGFAFQNKRRGILAGILTGIGGTIGKAIHLSKHPEQLRLIEDSDPLARFGAAIGGILTDPGNTLSNAIASLGSQLYYGTRWSIFEGAAQAVDRAAETGAIRELYQRGADYIANPWQLQSIERYGRAIAGFLRGEGSHGRISYAAIAALAEATQKTGGVFKSYDIAQITEAVAQVAQGMSARKFVEKFIAPSTIPEEQWRNEYDLFNDPSVVAQKNEQLRQTIQKVLEVNAQGINIDSIAQTLSGALGMQYTGFLTPSGSALYQTALEMVRRMPVEAIRTNLVTFSEAAPFIEQLKAIGASTTRTKAAQVDALGMATPEIYEAHNLTAYMPGSRFKSVLRQLETFNEMRMSTDIQEAELADIAQRRYQELILGVEQGRLVSESVGYGLERYIEPIQQELISRSPERVYRGIREAARFTSIQDVLTGLYLRGQHFVDVQQLDVLADQARGLEPTQARAGLQGILDLGLLGNIQVAPEVVGKIGTFVQAGIDLRSLSAAVLRDELRSVYEPEVLAEKIQQIALNMPIITPEKASQLIRGYQISAAVREMNWLAGLEPPSLDVEQLGSAPDYVVNQLLDVERLRSELQMQGSLSQATNQFLQESWTAAAQGDVQLSKAMLLGAQRSIPLQERLGLYGLAIPEKLMPEAMVGISNVEFIKRSAVAELQAEFAQEKVFGYTDAIEAAYQAEPETAMGLIRGIRAHYQLSRRAIAGGTELPEMLTPGRLGEMSPEQLDVLSGLVGIASDLSIGRLLTPERAHILKFGYQATLAGDAATASRTAIELREYTSYIEGLRKAGVVEPLVAFSKFSGMDATQRSLVAEVGQIEAQYALSNLSGIYQSELEQLRDAAVSSDFGKASRLIRAMQVGERARQTMALRGETGFKSADIAQMRPEQLNVFENIQSAWTDLTLQNNVRYDEYFKRMEAAVKSGTSSGLVEAQKLLRGVQIAKSLDEIYQSVGVGASRVSAEQAAQMSSAQINAAMRLAQLETDFIAQGIEGYETEIDKIQEYIERQQLGQATQLQMGVQMTANILNRLIAYDLDTPEQREAARQIAYLPARQRAQVSAVLSGDPIAMSRFAVATGQYDLYTTQIGAFGGTRGLPAGYDEQLTPQFIQSLRTTDVRHGGLSSYLQQRAGIDLTGMNTLDLKRHQERIQTQQMLFSLDQAELNLKRRREVTMGAGLLTTGFAPEGRGLNIRITARDLSRESGLDDAVATWKDTGERLKDIVRGLNEWMIEDKQIRLKREQEDFNMAQQLKAKEFNWKRFEMEGRHWYERYYFNMNRTFTQMDWAAFDMSLQRQRQIIQTGWQREDLYYNRNRNVMQFGWQMEDIDRNLRYARGMDFINLLRQRERAVIDFSMQMSQSQREERRLDTIERWNAEDFERERQRFEQRRQWAIQEFEMERRHFEERRALQLEELMRDNERIEKARQWMQEERRIEDERIAMRRASFILEQKEAENIAQYSRQIQLNMAALGRAMEIIATRNKEVEAAAGYLARTGELLARVSPYLNVFNEGLQRTINSVVNMIDSLRRALSGASNLRGGGPGVGGGYVPTQHADGGYVPHPSRNFNQYVPNVSFATGGYTGLGSKYMPAGIVHGGEYVIPQEGAPVVRGDNPETVHLLGQIVDLLRKLVDESGRNPQMNVNITTNETRQALELMLKDFERAKARFRG